MQQRMMRERIVMVTLIALLAVSVVAGGAGIAAQEPDRPDAPAGAAFTYQGRLTDDQGAPLSGQYDFQFRLYDGAEQNANQIGDAVMVNDKEVDDGLFTVELDFGASAFTGDARWLEISVRQGGSSGGYTQLLPRQALAPAPYAVHAAQAPWSGLTGVPAGIADGDDDTTYSAGAGLSLSGAAFSADFAGSGSATTVARSDHDHLGQTWTGNDNSLVISGTFGTGQNPAPLVLENASGYGVRVLSAGSDGVRVDSVDGDGLEVESAFADGVRVGSAGNDGVYVSSAGNHGVNVRAADDYGIYVFEGNADGDSSGGAGYFGGNVEIAGYLSKTGGSFRIDHPQDPENMYLSHSFVESPDMMNIYNGNVTTGDEGFATVTLPDYFEALNTDYRYQLTVIGAFAQAIIAEEIEDNHFVIQTDEPNVKVSWQVTGIRNDPYARANRIQVEEEKPAHERGFDLHPEVYGLPSERGIGHRRGESR